jgi:hypothetical protein
MDFTVSLNRITQGFDFGPLTSLALSAKGLRILRVALDSYLPCNSNTWGLPLRPGDRLPPLYELDLGKGLFDFDQEHCVGLKESIGQTTLRKLDLGA